MGKIERNIIRRDDLVDIVHQRLKDKYKFTPKETIYNVLKETFRCIPDLIEEGNKISICRCMTLQPYLKPERKVVVWGKTTFAPERYRVRFTPLHDMKRACENLYKNEQEKEEEEDDE